MAENKNLKDISSKLKVLEKSHHNNITNKNSACFGVHAVDNPPIYIPKHEINSEYHVYGNFVHQNAHQHI